MSAVEEMKDALHEARTEAATLRIRVHELEAKLVEMANACDPVLNPAGGPERDRGAAAIRSAGLTERCVGYEPHPWAIYADDFCVAPVYDTKPGEVARPRYCGRPRSEHQS